MQFKLKMQNKNYKTITHLTVMVLVASEQTHTSCFNITQPQVMDLIMYVHIL